ncbi:hypothetical protein PIB30_076620 [Stylosanthes scabra]|uniref:RRM domain-containing protein n=1 Tax=Stylosanthes scabra TaxID=79078 RepID=A0ABU6UP82_9FABA|nr:hypothetical protein [Stylosanthes scabra]
MVKGHVGTSVNKTKDFSMEGVRGAVKGECGKHGEGSGFAGGRNKGESGGGFPPGVRRNINRGFYTRSGADEKTTIFVDNLPDSVIKRELYEEFGRDGYVTDIFISRKLRLKAKGPFAFISFQRIGGALRSIRRLNGTLWHGGKLFLTMSKFRRYEGVYLVNHQRQVHLRTTTKWVEVRRTTTKDTGISGTPAMRKERDQKGKAKDRHDEWKGSVEIECRDMGPYRCLITFSSVEIKEGAMENELLYSVFYEVRPHWNSVEACRGEFGLKLWGFQLVSGALKT